MNYRDSDAPENREQDAKVFFFVVIEAARVQLLVLPETCWSQGTLRNRNQQCEML